LLAIVKLKYYTTTMSENHIPFFDSTRILIYGDVMLDRYWYGQALRISPEAPVPVVHVQNHEARPGGAANVAVNVASLGAQVTLLGIVGEDLEASQLRSALEAKGVECHLLALAGQPTITKLRVIGHQQQLIRMDFENPLKKMDDSCLLETYERQ